MERKVSGSGVFGLPGALDRRNVFGRVIASSQSHRSSVDPVAVADHGAGAAYGVCGVLSTTNLEMRSHRSFAGAA